MKHSSPGFVDLQVNGYLGVYFGNTEASEADLRKACDGVLASGTAAFLPTVITAPLDEFKICLPRLASLCTSEAYQGRLPGLHIEGPFLSPKPGAIGAHNPDYCQAANTDTLDQLQEWADGCIKLITIAAEIPNAPELCAHARKMGITVANGHSLALEEDLSALIDAGATASTHLGNGLPNELPRLRNPIWAALALNELTAMLITDGHHLPESVQKVMIRAKGVDRCVVVSDASPIAGMPPGNYDTLGNKVVLEENGLLHNPEKKCLVGSSAMMIDCMNQLAGLDLLHFEELQRVSIHNPLSLIGLTLKDIDQSQRVQYDSELKQFSVIE